MNQNDNLNTEIKNFLNLREIRPSENAWKNLECKFEYNHRTYRKTLISMLAISIVLIFVSGFYFIELNSKSNKAISYQSIQKQKISKNIEQELISEKTINQNSIDLLTTKKEFNKSIKTKHENQIVKVEVDWNETTRDKAQVFSVESNKHNSMINSERQEEQGLIEPKLEEKPKNFNVANKPLNHSKNSLVVEESNILKEEPIKSNSSDYVNADDLLEKVENQILKDEFEQIPRRIVRKYKKVKGSISQRNQIEKSKNLN